MNEWKEKIEELKESIEEFNRWVDADYSQWGLLPKGVKNLLACGLVNYEDRIAKYEKWAKEEIS